MAKTIVNAINGPDRDEPLDTRELDWQRALPTLLPKIEAFHSTLDPREQQILRQILDAASEQIADHSPEALTRKLTSFAQHLTPDDYLAFRMLLSLAGGGLLPRALFPAPGSREAECFEIIARTIRELVPSGILWRGRPDFMTDVLLCKLQEEAYSRRPSALRRNRAFSSPVGPVASNLATSPDFMRLITTFAPKAQPSGFATYLYYDEPGAGVSAHVDRGEFNLNIVLCIDHVWNESPFSRLLLYLPGATAVRAQLEPGELVLFRAGGTFHGREDVHDGERVTVLTLGLIEVNGSPRQASFKRKKVRKRKM
jgi:hypothetical protein